MTYHEWGDEDFNWHMLSEAMKYISDEWWETAKCYPIMKEKYGTIRYEFTSTWLKSNAECEDFCKLLLKAAKKFKEVDAEIVDEACVMFEDKVPFKKYIKAFKKIVTDKGYEPWREYTESDDSND